MHDALSGERVHTSKNWVVGYFTGRTGSDLTGGRSGGEGTDKGKRFQNCVVRIDQPRGAAFRTIGVSDRENRMWLLPEEALYSLERGSLDVRWGVPGDEVEGEGSIVGNQEVSKKQEQNDDDDDGYVPSLSDLPMSLQGAYATFISDDDLTLAMYTVFAGLRRSGYTVIRAPTWDNSPASTSKKQPDDTTGPDSTFTQNEIASPSPPTIQQSLFHWPSLRSFLARVFHLLFRREARSRPYERHPNSSPSLGPLVAPGLYRSYADIYRALTLVPFHDPTSRPSRLHAPAIPNPSSNTSVSPPPTTCPSTPTTPPSRICYHVYKPTTPYRKTSPPPPDFHLAVIDARSHPTIPHLTELGTLLEEMPLHDPKEDEKLKKGRPEMRLKAGTRSVVLAVVDNGVVSFLRIAETGSGREMIYEGKARRGGGKRGNRGRGGGRGRGRG